MSGPLVFIDTETTGLDVHTHQLVEVAWSRGGITSSLVVEHTLEAAAPQALEINGYWRRSLNKLAPTDRSPIRGIVADLLDDLRGATLVGSNPYFDGAFLRKYLGVAVWHHRMIDIGTCAMWQFGWDAPAGQAGVTKHLQDLGYQMPEPDHTAHGDVLATRAAFYALRELREKARP